MNRSVIMVVDDDDGLRESVCEYLEEDGFQVVCVDSGTSALNQLRAEPRKPDLILLDLMMPGMNGWQFREQQLHDPTLASIPVVVLTASRDLHGIQADEVVYKPLKLTALLNVVRRHLRVDANGHEQAVPAPRSVSADARPEVNTARADKFLSMFAGGGEMSARMRAFDWLKSPVGDVASWPQSLRAAMSICLGSRFPICIYWGPSLVTLYNDGWSTIPGAKHPSALGKPAKEVWPEIWDTISGWFDRVVGTGESIYQEGQFLAMHRHGYTEECYFDFTFSPIRGESGRVEGVFNAVVETTFRFVNERRTRVLRDLAAATATARTATDACTLAAKSLGEAIYDVPFCALFLSEAEAPEARLAASAGLSPDSPAAPKTVTLDNDSGWPFGRAARSKQVEVVHDLKSLFRTEFPGGVWPEPTASALVAPLLSAGKISGFLVLGANPRRAIDDDYLLFAERAASHVASAIATAMDYENRDDLLGNAQQFAEQALRESEERFRNMADNAPVMVWMTEPDATCSYLNQFWYDFTGQTAETGLGFGWLKAIHPDDAESSHQAFAAANAKREPFALEYRLRRNDGEYRWAIDSASPRIGSNGEFLGYIGSVIDITDRKNGELALQASEARYRAMFETAAVSLWEEDFSAVSTLVDELKEAHGIGLRAFLAANPSVVSDAVSKVRIVNVNPATLRMLGATSEEQLLSSLHRIFLPESYAVFLEELIAMAEKRRLVVADTALQTLAGERIDVAFSIAFSDEGYERVLVSLTDISLGKIAERERDARMSEMERAVRFSEMFVGILGHDLRNPLSSIMTAASLLEARADSAKIATPVGRIIVSADRMERMISQLLDLTRIRLGSGLPLDRAKADLTQLSRSIAEELEPVYKREIRIEALGDVKGMWDGDRLSQLLSNLVGNACQHGASGAVVYIELDGTKHDIVHLTVKNRGVISADLLPVLFEPLRLSGHEKREGSSGLGLGLYITQQIAFAHGGQIRVESSEEHGTRFVVDLPRDVPTFGLHPAEAR